MNQKNMVLSAIIIARNEAPRIGKCIEALQFADEVIVVDNSSTDNTASVARQKGAVVLSRTAVDFAKLRNIAASHAKSAWILYIDADEIVSVELRRSIQEAIGNTTNDISGYEIHRENYYLGTMWPKGEWMLRLFRTQSLQGWRGKLHETAVVKGKIAKLSGKLLHDTHRTLTEMVHKTNEWSETEAALRFSIHHPRITWWRIIRVTITGFWYSFFSQEGWRAGTVGWIESMYQGFSMFITYAKLWELQNNASKN